MLDQRDGSTRIEAIERIQTRVGRFTVLRLEMKFSASVARPGGRIHCDYDPTHNRTETTMTTMSQEYLAALLAKASYRTFSNWPACDTVIADHSGS